MFKLTVVGGPTRGATYSVKDGENSLGRVQGNDIVLPSNRVSKKHCVLVVNNGEVLIKDAGSSNGTFVNGVLTKLKKLIPGDRISVGEYVLELLKPEGSRNLVIPQQRPNIQNSNVVPFPSQTSPGLTNGGFQIQNANAQPQKVDDKNLKEKVSFYFEKYILNFLYNLNETQEWRSLLGMIIGVLTFFSAILSVYPIIEATNERLSFEAAGRATLLARQIVEKNSALLFERLESKTDVSSIEKEPHVIGAYLIDMEGRIYAPGRFFNQYMNEADEAAFSAQVREDFRNHEAKERIVKYIGNAGNKIAAAVPLRIFSPNLGKNVVAAIGVVFYDQQPMIIDSGTQALYYIQALIFSALVAWIAFFSIYRVSLKPILSVNEQVDSALKGNASVIQKKFKMEEIDGFIDNLNTTLQRVSSSGGTHSGSGNDQSQADEITAGLKFAFSNVTSSGVILFGSDKRILYINPKMEEITGIRSDAALGQLIADVARDEAFKMFVEDALSKAPIVSSIAMGQTLQEDFEFSGTQYKMESFAVGSALSTKAYVLVAGGNG